MSRRKSQYDQEKLKKIGDHIKWLRKSVKLSQRKFGKSIGISGNYLSNIETGQVEPKMPVLLAIESRYAITPDQVLTGKDFPFSIKELPVTHISEPKSEYQSQKEQLVNMVKEILQSEYALALAVDIRFFHNTMQKDREREKLKKEIAGLKKEMMNWEQRLSEINSDFTNHVEDSVKT